MPTAVPANERASRQRKLLPKGKVGGKENNYIEGLLKKGRLEEFSLLALYVFLLAGEATLIQRKRILKNFLSLVRIPSPTYQEREVADYAITHLKHLGLCVQEDASGKKIGSTAGNIIAKLKGDPSHPTLLFGAHMDTVEPASRIEPVVERGIIWSRGNAILGADDKSGLAAILEGVESVIEDRTPHGSIEVILTTSEEKGLSGSKHLDKSRLKADFGFVFDEGDAPGKIVVQAPWQNTIKATFKGKAAHAGVGPEEGISAISAAARAIARMKLGRISKDTTANIGLIKGGTAVNIIPERVDLEGEARSWKIDRLEQQTEKMSDYLRRGAAELGAKVQIEVRREYNGFTLSKDDGVVKLAAEAIRAAGAKLRLEASGGGSDTNILNEAGIPTVNLSTGMNKVHSTEEFIRIDDLGTTARIVVELIRQATKPKR